DPGDAEGIAGEGVRRWPDGEQRGRCDEAHQPLRALPPVHRRDHLPRAHDGLPLRRDRGQGCARHLALRGRRVPRARRGVPVVLRGGGLHTPLAPPRTGRRAVSLPVIVLSILFGLSMDYEVSLASRIREEYLRGGNARRAVTAGVAGVGRVIVAAAIIMGVVF